MSNFKDILIQKEKNSNNLPYLIAKLMIDQKLTISIAESITGGKICANLVKIPGASKFFIGGIIAYSNFSKVNDCRVNPKTIQRFSPVSSQVASEMAQRVQEKFKSDIALSTTGYAGPQQQNERVGLVYIGLQFGSNGVTKNFTFKGNRENIITHTYIAALDLIRHQLGTHSLNK